MRPINISNGWKRLCLCLSYLIVVSLLCTRVLASKLEVTKSYVVIGAFSFEKNAERFTSFANKKDLNAVYAINSRRNLFYVYVFVSEERDRAYKELLTLRGLHPEFKDAWVFEGELGVLGQP
ncbi:MAG: SPOR domain-containing protein, partial [Bacteroidota bacterium]